MKRSKINPISKKKCKENMLEAQSRSHSLEICNLNCKECDKPKIMNTTIRKPINPISTKKRKEIEAEKPIRAELTKRANGCCEQCGRPKEQSLGGLHPHEEIFRSKGGKMTATNSKLLCHVCHSAKHGIRVVEH
jgi:hypothetical protein